MTKESKQVLLINIEITASEELLETYRSYDPYLLRCADDLPGRICLSEIGHSYSYGYLSSCAPNSDEEPPQNLRLILKNLLLVCIEIDKTNYLAITDTAVPGRYLEFRAITPDLLAVATIQCSSNAELLFRSPSEKLTIAEMRYRLDIEDLRFETQRIAYQFFLKLHNINKHYFEVPVVREMLLYLTHRSFSKSFQRAKDLATDGAWSIIRRR